MKLKEIFSQDYIDGMKQGFLIANNICEREGFEILFPNVDEMEVHK
jgi:hypothetical protein